MKYGSLYQFPTYIERSFFCLLRIFSNLRLFLSRFLSLMTLSSIKKKNTAGREIKVKIAKIAEKNYKEFFKALLSFETNVEDEVILEKVYEFYFNEDDVTLLNEELEDRILYEEQIPSENQKEL